MTSLAAVLQSSQDPPIRIETEAMKLRPDSIFGQREIQYFVIGGKKPSVGTRGLALPAIERARVIIQNRNAAAVEVAETRQEMEWLRDHGREYAGRWIAVKGDRLLAVGASASEVYAQIRQRADAPMVAKVGQNDDLPFAGW